LYAWPPISGILLTMEGAREAVRAPANRHSISTRVLLVAQLDSCILACADLVRWEYRPICVIFGVSAKHLPLAGV